MRACMYAFGVLCAYATAFPCSIGHVCVWACARVGMCACGHVRVWACAIVGMCTCGHVHVRACARASMFLAVLLFQPFFFWQVRVVDRKIFVVLRLELKMP